MGRWYVLRLLLSTGPVLCGRLANMGLLRDELGFDLVDERHWREWVFSSAPEFSRYVPFNKVRHRLDGHRSRRL
jgi:hypothetical protein